MCSPSVQSNSSSNPKTSTCKHVHLCLVSSLGRPSQGLIYGIGVFASIPKLMQRNRNTMNAHPLQCFGAMLLKPWIRQKQSHKLVCENPFARTTRNNKSSSICIPRLLTIEKVTRYLSCCCFCVQNIQSHKLVLETDRVFLAIYPP